MDATFLGGSNNDTIGSRVRLRWLEISLIKFIAGVVVNGKNCSLVSLSPGITGNL
jgi:hypothetical protein